MNIKALALAAAIAVSASPAFAADQTVSFIDNLASFSTREHRPPLVGGDDVITFTGLASGTYNFLLSFSTIDIGNVTATLNGQSATILGDSEFSFGKLRSTGVEPFYLTLTGIATDLSQYSGQLQVTAVPEPETWALMLAGLVGMGYVSRRRRPRQ